MHEHDEGILSPSGEVYMEKNIVSYIAYKRIPYPSIAEDSPFPFQTA